MLVLDIHSPQITITDAAGNGEQLSMLLDCSVRIDVAIATGNYAAGSSAPTVTFTNDAGDTTGTGATGTSVLGFAIASITLNNSRFRLQKYSCSTCTTGG